MKKISATLCLLNFIYLGSSICSFAQVTPLAWSDAFPGWYNLTYTIKDNTGVLVFDQNMSTHDIYAGSFHGGTNQQWLIMPTFPGSNEAFIVNKSNGYIMDRNTSTQNLYCNSVKYTGGANQKFRIGQVSAGTYGVYSSGTTYVMDHNMTSNSIYFNINFSGGLNQQISFLPTSNSLGNSLTTQVVNYNTFAIKPPELTGLQEPFQKGARVGEVLVSTTIIPFELVNDPGWTLAAQLAYSPYYRLERRQYYKLDSQQPYAAGDVTTYSAVTTVGCVTKNSLTIEKTIGVSYEASMKLTIPLKVASMDVGQNLKANMGLDITQTNEVTNSFDDTYSYTLKRTSTQAQLFFFYILTDEYTLYRMNEDGKNWALQWEYADPDQKAYFMSYPNETPALAMNAQSPGNIAPVNSIPVMTSDVAPVGIASSSSDYSAVYAAWKALDGEDASGAGSRWISASTGVFTPQWLAYDFGAVANVQSYSIAPEGYSCINRSPNSWDLQGYDGVNWVSIDSQSNCTISYWQATMERSFTISQTASFSKYRLLIKSVNGSSVTSIIRFKLFATNTMALKSGITNHESGNNLMPDIKQESNNDVLIAPNPSNGNINISINPKFLTGNASEPDSMNLQPNIGNNDDVVKQGITIEIYSMKGDLIKVLKQTTQQENYILGLTPGVYILKCAIEGVFIRKKIVIQ